MARLSAQRSSDLPTAAPAILASMSGKPLVCRALAVPALVACLLSGAATGAPPGKQPTARASTTTTATPPAAVADPVQPALAKARSIAVRIVFPNGHTVTSTPVSGTGLRSEPTFSYPADGSVVSAGETRASADANVYGRDARAASASQVGSLSLFGGEITASSVSGGAIATAGATVGGSFGGNSAVDLVALGRPHAYGRAALGDWGSLRIARHAVERTEIDGLASYSAIAVGLEISLDASHGGLPAGSLIQIGYSEVSTRAAPAPPVAPTARPGDRPQLRPHATDPVVGVPQVITPDLKAGPYVFPVFGSARIVDTFGDDDGSGSYKHGVEITGNLGQPVLAAATGTLYEVGWTPDRGNAIELRDSEGNQFTYAHLSAFASSTQKGAEVIAGDVIGFLGSDDSAGGIAGLLEFEVHPVSMLYLGSDGAASPGHYLAGWRRLSVLSRSIEAGWAPAVPGTIAPPQPSVALIASVDISSVDPLVPRALGRFAARLGPSG